MMAYVSESPDAHAESELELLLWRLADAASNRDRIRAIIAARSAARLILSMNAAPEERATESSPPRPDDEQAEIERTLELYHANR